MTECERAKQWLSENWEGSFCWDDLLALMQFMREERARGMEETASLIRAQQCKNPYYGSAIYKKEVVKFSDYLEKIAVMFDEQAKALREEGGQR